EACATILLTDRSVKKDESPYRGAKPRNQAGKHAEDHGCGFPPYCQEGVRGHEYRRNREGSGGVKGAALQLLLRKTGPARENGTECGRRGRQDHGKPDERRPASNAGKHHSTGVQGTAQSVRIFSPSHGAYV